MAGPLAAAAGRVAAGTARRWAPKAMGLAAAAALATIGGMSDLVVARPSPPAAVGGPRGCPAPPGLVPAAELAAAGTTIPATVLLAVACVETGYGRADNDASLEQLLPPDILEAVDGSRLDRGGATMLALGLERRTLGSWVNPAPVTTEHGVEHAMGFMQFLPSTWRSQAAGAERLVGHRPDPYEPGDAMTVAGSYLASVAGPGRDLRQALRQYGGSDAYAARVMNMAVLAQARTGRALDCDRPTVTQPYGRVPGVFIKGVQVEPLMGGLPFHEGVDLACAPGTGVRAVTAGVAHVEVGASGYGISVLVEASDPAGGDRVRYAHLSTAGVVEGQAVLPGMLLGTEGSTGASSGPHLHFELDRRGPDGGYYPAPPCGLLDRTWVVTEACGQG